MKHLLVVFYSQSGRNQALALAVFQAARNNSKVQVKLLNAFEANSGDWLWADAFILVCPENFGAISGGMKQFLDRIFYPCIRAQEHKNNGAQLAKPYQLVFSCGNDGSQSDMQITRILKGLGAKPVQASIFIYGEPSVNDIELMTELGQGFVEAITMGIF